MTLGQAEQNHGVEGEGVDVRWLSPQDATVFKGTYSLLHCTVRDEAIYRGVFAVRMFPVSYPERFISLRYIDSEDNIQEIGVIERLAEFPPEAQDFIRASLNKHYYEQQILRVHRARCEFGMLFFDVQTQRGREEIIVPWRYDRAEDCGERGKLLLDALDNRFVIPDMDALPAADRRRFKAYIYW